MKNKIIKMECLKLPEGEQKNASSGRMLKMKKQTTQIKKCLVWSVLAFLLCMGFWTAPRVEAASGAGATILNTVRVDYKDAGGLTSYSADASTSVTISLVKAGLTLSGRPTSGSTGKTAAVPSGQTPSSGQTASYLIALTANSNGGDTYSLSAALSNASGLTGQTIAWSTIRPDGTTQITGSNPASVALGASVIQANTATTISIPGGSLATAIIQDYATGYKVLVVNGVDYVVSGISGAGVAPSNTHVGNTYYNTTGTATAETLIVITLGKNASGANVDPSFTINALIGQQVGEQILVKVDVQASCSTPGVNGTVDFNATTTSSGGGNSVSLASAITTTYTANNLQVRKNVRNITKSGSFAATATGDPGDVLEYQIEVNNAGSTAATTVSALDAVPVYTKLACGSGALGTTVCTGTGTDIIATITTGSNTSLITYQSSDNECGGSPANVGAGDAAGYAAGSALHFYLGTGCTASAGGSVAGSATYTIVYRVKIN